MTIISSGKTIIFAWTGAQMTLAGSVFDVGSAVIHAVGTVDESLWLSWKAGRSLNSLLTLEPNRCYRLQVGNTAIDVPVESAVSFGSAINKPFSFQGVNIGGLEFNLTWQPPTNTIVRSYEIQVFLSSGSYGNSVIRVASNFLDYVVAVGVAGTYKARIRARTDLNVSDWQDIAANVAVTIEVPPPPPVPVITFVAGRPSDSGLLSFQDMGGIPNDPSAAQNNVDVWAFACQTYPAGNRVILFPAGTWYFNDSIKTINPSTSKWFARWIIQGDSQATTTIRLIDNAVGFNEPTIPKHFMVIGGAENTTISANPSGNGNTSFGLRVFDITINTGNNLGAIGLDFLSHNWGCVERVKITGVGVVGLDLIRPSGPHLVKNVTVEGFNYGIRSFFYQYSQTYVNITLIDQDIAGFLVNNNVVVIENLISVNQVPAVQLVSTYDDALVVIIGGNLTGGSPLVSAILSNNATLYLRNIVSEGYLSTVDLGNGKYINGDITEYSTSTYKLFSSPPASLNLPIQVPPPSFTSATLSDWVNAKTLINNSVDSLAGINSAIATGKPIIYFPRQVPGSVGYAVSNTLVIPPSVKRINGNHSSITITGSLWASGVSMPLIKTTGTTNDPLFIDSLDIFYASNSTGMSILHESTRPLVIRNVRFANAYISITNSPGAGPVFIEDALFGSPFETGSFAVQIKNGCKYFIRSLNCEYDNAILNDGGELWMLGFKSEGFWENIRTINGGKSEFLGGLAYPIEDITSSSVVARGGTAIPLFSVVDSSFSVVFAMDAIESKRAFTVILSETRAGVTRTFNRANLQKRGGSGVRASVITAYPYAIAPTVESLVLDLSYVADCNKAPIPAQSQAALDLYLKTLRSDGLLDKIFQMYPLLGGSLEPASKAFEFRVTQPILSDLINYNVPESAYSVSTGVKGNKSTSALGTSISPAGSTTATDIGLHVWALEPDSDTTVKILMGGTNSSTNQYTAVGFSSSSPAGDAATFGGNIFTNNNGAKAAPSLPGMVSAINNGTRATQLYQNGVAAGTVGSASGALTAALASSLWLLGSARAGQSGIPKVSNPSDRTLQWGAITKGMTAVEVNLFYRRTLKYMQEIQRWQIVLGATVSPTSLSSGMRPGTINIIPSALQNSISVTFKSALNATGTSVLQSDMIALDSLITNLINSGLWTRTTFLMPLMGQTQAHAMRSIVNLSGSPIVHTMTQSDTAGYTKAGGVQGNTARSINTGRSQTGLITSTNGSLHAWTSQTETNNGNRYLMGYWAFDSTNYTVLGRNGSREGGTIAGALSSFANGPTNATGLLSVVTDATRQAQYYVNGVASGAPGTVAAQNTEIGMYLLSGFKRGSTVEGQTSRNIGFAALTGAFTASEMATFNTHVQTFLTAIGRA